MDKCPSGKYTYSSLKHILQIGFKTYNYGGFNFELNVEYVFLLLAVGLRRPLGGLL